MKQKGANNRLIFELNVQLMVKELISKGLVIIFFLGALHATAGTVIPEKKKLDDKTEQSVVIESDSTETSKEGPAKINKLGEKVSDKVGQKSEGIVDDEELSSESSSSSIVSFNFVYYLLEKFKFSDLLGQ